MKQPEDEKHESPQKVFNVKDLKAFFESEEFKTWLQLAEKPYHGKKPE